MNVHYPESWAETHATIASFAEREPIDLGRLDAIETALDLPLRANPLLATWHAIYGDVAYDEFRRFHFRFTGEEPDYAWHLVATILRRYTVPRYAHAIPCPEAVDAIRAEADGRGVVEVGAGLGYWAGLLQCHGVDVVATDLAPGDNPWCHESQEPWTEVAALDAVTAAGQAGDAGRVLFVCWPDMDVWAGQAVAAYHQAGGDRVIYVGERDGCTGDDELRDLLGLYDEEPGTVGYHKRLFAAAAEVEVPQWDGIHDRLFICRRRGAD